MCHKNFIMHPERETSVCKKNQIFSSISQKVSIHQKLKFENFYQNMFYLLLLFYLYGRHWKVLIFVTSTNKWSFPARFFLSLLTHAIMRSITLDILFFSFSILCINLVKITLEKKIDFELILFSLLLSWKGWKSQKP